MNVKILNNLEWCINCLRGYVIRTWKISEMVGRKEGGNLLSIRHGLEQLAKQMDDLALCMNEDMCSLRGKLDGLATAAETLLDWLDPPDAQENEVDPESGIDLINPPNFEIEGEKL